MPGIESERKNIAAFTPAEAPYPPYVSINQDGRIVSIAVRSPAVGPERFCGPVATIHMQAEDFLRLADEIARWAARVRAETEICAHEPGDRWPEDKWPVGENFFQCKSCKNLIESDPAGGWRRALVS